jgi:hypothetical protein
LFKGEGLWVEDIWIELWLYFLTQQINLVSGPPMWLREAQEEWLYQARSGANGCISAQLDKIITNGDRCNIVINLSRAALASIKGFGEYLPAGLVQAWGVGGSGTIFTRDIATTELIEFGDKLIRLLEGGPGDLE